MFFLIFFVMKNKKSFLKTIIKQDLKHHGSNLVFLNGEMNIHFSLRIIWLFHLGYFCPKNSLNQWMQSEIWLDANIISS